MTRDTPEQRQRWYRSQGWWTGERLQDRYARISRANPQGLAVVDDRGARLSHEDLWGQAAALAAQLGAHGLDRGDVVLLFLPNRVEWQVAFLAVLQAGAVPATIPIRTDAQALAHVSRLAGVRLLIASERHRHWETGEVALAAAQACEQVPAVLTISEQGERRWVRPRPALGEREARADALDHLMFTSSTTGLPKAVMHTADSLAALNVTFSERFGLGPDQPIFMPSPLGHSVGAIHGARLSLYNGAPLVLQDRWDPQTALALVAEHGCAFTAAATPFLKDLLDAPWQASQPKLASLRWFLCGGAQVPPALMEKAENEFPCTRVTVLWGMTEGGLTTCIEQSSREQRLHTGGVGLPGLELCVLGERQEKLPSGEEGELAMRGPGVFIGYMGQDELYRSLLTTDGYFRTGDLVRVDTQGYVRITGRLKDLIIRGGVNISPVPIEDALAAHPEVRSVAVIGSPDERLGERICAVIVPASAARPELEALVAFVRDQGLPRHLWPEAVRYVDDMPRTPAGKIRKNRLREQVEKSAGIVSIDRGLAKE